MGAEGEGEEISWVRQKGIGTQELYESSMGSDFAAAAAAADAVAYAAVASMAAGVDGEEEKMEEVEEEHCPLEIWECGQGVQALVLLLV